MKQHFKRSSKYIAAFSLALFVLFLALGIGGSGIPGAGIADAKISDQQAPADNPAGAAIDAHNPNVQAVMDVQNRHTQELLRVSGVVGTATGLTEDNVPAVLVFLKGPVRKGMIPETIEEKQVITMITGEISAMPGGNINTSIFQPPVPIGVSTGNFRECSAGTISARVTDGTNVYALSNNHVYALENNGRIGDIILQPGLYDTNCFLNGNNQIGTLYKFVPIDFSGGPNTVDAAIALSSTGQLGNATPAGGYGMPNSVITAATSTLLNQRVQKYGRTTSLTRGTVSGINATVLVNYGSAGTATFVNQITVSSNKPFIKPGDSGSLLVTDDANANPVGLLFAGSSSGKFAIANQINNVLSSFVISGVTIKIDGK